MRAGKLTLALATKDGESLSATAPLNSHTDRFDLLLQALNIALPRSWRPGGVITHMHLIAGNLRMPGYVQRGLFDPPDVPALATVKREVNETHGRFSVRSGATLFLPEL